MPITTGLIWPVKTYALLKIQIKPTIRGRKGSIKSNEQGMMTQWIFANNEQRFLIYGRNTISFYQYRGVLCTS